jgi:hypothetical protein
MRKTLKNKDNPYVIATLYQVRMAYNHFFGEDMPGDLPYNEALQMLVNDIRTEALKRYWATLD